MGSLAFRRSRKGTTMYTLIGMLDLATMIVGAFVALLAWGQRDNPMLIIGLSIFIIGATVAVVH